MARARGRPAGTPTSGSGAGCASTRPSGAPCCWPTRWSTSCSSTRCRSTSSPESPPWSGSPRSPSWSPGTSGTSARKTSTPDVDWYVGQVTVVKINAITVPADSGDELARRFAARAGAVDDQDGFEGFELFKPTDERTTWLVVTRWRDEEAFQAWVKSPAFGHGHRSAAERSGGEAPPHVGISSELWSYEIAGGSAR